MKFSNNILFPIILALSFVVLLVFLPLNLAIFQPSRTYTDIKYRSTFMYPYSLTDTSDDARVVFTNTKTNSGFSYEAWTVFELPSYLNFEEREALKSNQYVKKGQNLYLTNHLHDFFVLSKNDIYYVFKFFGLYQNKDQILSSFTPDSSYHYWTKYNLDSPTQFYPSVVFNYPSSWTIQVNNIEGTSDRKVLLSDQGSLAISVAVSELDFNNDFYNSQKDYLGPLNKTTINSRTAYIFPSVYGADKIYYFPQQQGYVYVELLDPYYSPILDRILNTLTFTPTNLRY